MNKMIKKKAYKKIIVLLVVCSFIFVLIQTVNNREEHRKENMDNQQTLDKDQTKDKEQTSLINKIYSKVSISEHTTYQTMESFGASGAWWSQYVGGWDKPYGDGTKAVRDEIASLLYSKEEGIGLTNYRYNVGAGSADSGNGSFTDPNRRAQSFETAPFEYDWSKDANAVWFLKKVVELGAEEVVFFCNSPIERLTVNGLAHMSEKNKVNLLPENYVAFARYVLDVTEHFVAEGIPIKFVSPMNEPQWDWLNGQEGCYYKPQEVVGVYQAFLEELETRETLSQVELSGPESGEWGNLATTYTGMLLKDDVLSKHFTTIDNHSYWTNASAKKSFKNWMTINFPEIKLRTSEWCEMVNGSDYTMDSAFNLVDVLYEDLTILDVVSWQSWVAVAPGGYRDGLIYVNTEKKAYRATKRLWAYGNYSRYIRPGYVRVDISSNYDDIDQLRPVAFTGTNDDGNDELVMVFTNREDSKEFQLELKDSDIYDSISIYSTTEEHDLINVATSKYNKDNVIKLEAESISTVVLTKK